MTNNNQERVEEELKYLLGEYKETGDDSRITNVLEAVDALTLQVKRETVEEVKTSVKEKTKEQDGKATMKFADGTEADIKLHSDMALGYNQAMNDLLLFLEEFIKALDNIQNNEK